MSQSAFRDKIIDYGEDFKEDSIMIDVDKCVKEYMDGLTDLSEEQREKFSEMATAMGNFLNCMWKQRDGVEHEHKLDS